MPGPRLHEATIEAVTSPTASTTSPSTWPFGKGVSLKTLTLRYDAGDEGQSRDFVYDVSNLK